MIHPLNTGDKCPNAGLKETVGNEFCTSCPFREKSFRFFMDYGPSMLYVGKHIVYCSLDADSRGSKGEKPKRSRSGSHVVFSVPYNQLHAFRKTY